MTCGRATYWHQQVVIFELNPNMFFKDFLHCSSNDDLFLSFPMVSTVFAITGIAIKSKTPSSNPIMIKASILLFTFNKKKLNSLRNYKREFFDLSANGRLLQSHALSSQSVKGYILVPGWQVSCSYFLKINFSILNTTILGLVLLDF